MHRIVKITLSTLTVLVASLMTWQPTVSEVPLTKAEQFGLELQACNEAMAAGKPDKCKLYGKIQTVESFPDVKVQVVDSFPDIKVQVVENWPDKPGKWQMVTSFPDYKVQFVSSFPDYKIKYVENWPGCD